MEGLKVGDTVMVRKVGKAKPSGASRVESRVPDEVVMVDQVLGGKHIQTEALDSRGEIMFGFRCEQVPR